MANPIVFQQTGVVTSQWYTMNYQGYSPSNISVAVEVVSGGPASYTVQYTYDDPNNLQQGLTQPLAFSALTPVALGGPSTPATVTGDGVFTNPLVALRIANTTAGTVLRVRILQAGNG